VEITERDGSLNCKIIKLQLLLFSLYTLNNLKQLYANLFSEPFCFKLSNERVKDRDVNVLERTEHVDTNSGTKIRSGLFFFKMNPENS